MRGLLVMPGFIDAHTHMDMPFGGTITADDWDSGTAAAVAGGTTTIVDFALQDEGRSAGRRHRHLAGQGLRQDAHRLRPARRDLRPHRGRQGGDPRRCRSRGVCTVKVFMAYKGTSLFMPDEDLFEILQISRDAGVLVMVHAENGDVIAKLQQQALARGDVEPIWHARTRPEGVEAEATARAIRLAEIAGAPLRGRARHLRRRGRADPARARARGHGARRDLPAVPRAERGRPRPPRLRRREVRLLAAPARRQQPGAAVAPAAATATSCSSDRITARSTSPARRRWGAATSRRSPTACRGSRSARRCCGPTACARGASRRSRSSPSLATNQAHVHGLAPRKGLIVPGAEADIVVWDPELELDDHPRQPPRRQRLHAVRGAASWSAARSASTCAARSRSTTARWSLRPARGGSCRGRWRPHRGARSPRDARWTRRSSPASCASSRELHGGRGRRPARGLDRPLGRGSRLAAGPARRRSPASRSTPTRPGTSGERCRATASAAW